MGVWPVGLLTSSGTAVLTFPSMHMQLVFDNAISYNPPGNSIRTLAERMLAGTARHAQRLMPKLTATSGHPSLEDSLPRPTPMDRPEGSLPLARIPPYSADWAREIIARIDTLAPRKLAVTGDRARGRGGCSSRVHGGGRGRAHSAKGSGEDGDGGGGSGGEDDSEPCDPTPLSRGGSMLPDGQVDTPTAKSALPVLPYGWYLAANRPPTKVMSMPRGSSRGGFTVQQLQPESIPDWEERRLLWVQLKQMYVQVPGVQAASTAACMARLRREQAGGGGPRQQAARPERGRTSGTGSGIRSQSGGARAGQGGSADAEATLCAAALALEAELGLGPRPYGAGTAAAGAESADVFLRTLSNPSSMNVSLNISGHDLSLGPLPSSPPLAPQGWGPPLPATFMQLAAPSNMAEGALMPSAFVSLQGGMQGGASVSDTPSKRQHRSRGRAEGLAGGAASTASGMPLEGIAPSYQPEQGVDMDAVPEEGVWIGGKYVCGAHGSLNFVRAVMLVVSSACIVERQPQHRTALSAAHTSFKPPSREVADLKDRLER